jgi:hypothetical protein
MKVIKHKDKWYLQSETGYKEILLSTDIELQKDGVQAIDDEFLEWFVNNPSCEFVEIKLVEFEVDMGLDESCIEYGNYYKINIPKEESKFENFIENAINLMSIANSMFSKKEEPKQETLEEVAIRKRNELGLKGTIDGFIAGAKWQQERMYSEEEVINIIMVAHKSFSSIAGNFNEWFEQFKKK